MLKIIIFNAWSFNLVFFQLLYNYIICMHWYQLFCLYNCVKYEIEMKRTKVVNLAAVYPETSSSDVILRVGKIIINDSAFLFNQREKGFPF